LVPLPHPVVQAQRPPFGRHVSAFAPPSPVAPLLLLEDEEEEEEEEELHAAVTMSAVKTSAARI
jgi:hypothetical protein